MQTELKRSKLEGQIQDGPETSADEMLKTLDQIYQEAIEAETSVPVSEEIEGVELGDEGESQEAVRVTKKTNKKNERRTKKVMNPLIGEDVYDLGRKQFAKVDVVAVRANLKRRLEEKVELRECIMHEISNRPASDPVFFKEESTQRMPS